MEQNNYLVYFNFTLFYNVKELFIMRLHSNEIMMF